MAKIVVECTDPNDLEALEEAANQMAGRCNVTYFRQAAEMVDKGIAKSQYDAARQIANQSGETVKAVEHRISRGKKEIPQGGEQEKNPVTSGTSGNLEKLEKTWGGSRPGAGRKSNNQEGFFFKNEKEVEEWFKEKRNKQREQKRAENKARLEKISSQESEKLNDKYDVIVIDPPWPMQKIDRDVRPNQTDFDYPTMDESELSMLTLPAAENCHLWLWTTQKFMPMAFRLLKEWEFRYVCAFVWHKPGGFQPIGLPQYNSEFALYARKGSPEFYDTKSFYTCFSAPRGKHSEKPQEFYDMVYRVTAGKRLDMFNRRKIENFDGWGKEAK